MPYGGLQTVRPGCQSRWTFKLVERITNRRQRTAEHAVPPTSRCRSSPTSPSDGAYRSCFPQHSATQPQRRAAQQLLRSSALDSGSGMSGEEAAAAATDTALEALPAPLSMAVLYKFSRPHTLFGTFISVCSISALALSPEQWGIPALVGVCQALVPALLMNVSIVGLNQLYDVEIDKINKPYLPLASGEMTQSQGQWVVAVSGAVALAMGAVAGSAPLMITLAGSLLLGIVYSADLPLLRWKRNPVLAAACILAVRAVMVQLGFFFHMKRALGSASLTVTRPLAFALSFMLFVSIVIALFKDIPDIKGDRRAGISTMSVRMGAPQVFWTCIVLLEVAYAGAIGVGLMSPVLWSKVATTAAHAFMGGLLYWRAGQTDLEDSKSIYDCYMFVWRLFYCEYLLLPLFR